MLGGDGGWGMGGGGEVEMGGGGEVEMGGGGEKPYIHTHKHTKYCVVRFNVLIHEMLLLFLVHFIFWGGGTILLSPQA